LPLPPLIAMRRQAIWDEPDEIDATRLAPFRRLINSAGLAGWLGVVLQTKA
jgi:hypothetical protein